MKMDEWAFLPMDKYVYVLLIFLIGLPHEIFGNIAQGFSDIDCTFDEGLCDWTQDMADGFDWTRQSGATPYDFTGPSKDHTTGTGHYLFIQSSEHRGKSARLISPILESGQYCLTFWFHMYGNDIKSLTVLTKGTNESVISQKEGIYGNFWKYGWVHYESDENFKFVIEAKVKDDIYFQRGDIAIDDVRASTSCPLDCTFEDGACTWHDRVAGDTYNWAQNRSEATAGDSYIYIFKNHGAGSADLKSKLQEPGLKCMSIRLRITGNEDNTLAVFLLKDDKDDELIRSIPNKKSQEPEEMHVQIYSSVPYKVLLRGNISSGENENIHIIEITTVTEHCRKDCDSRPCLNKATCEHSSSDDTYTCVCTEGWTGQHCTDIVSTTEAPSTAETETSSSNGSSQPKEEQGQNQEDSKSSTMLYIIIASAGAVVLLIVIALLILLLRNKQRKRGLNDTNNAPMQLGNIHAMTKKNTYEFNEAVYEEPDTENTDCALKPNIQNMEDENEYSEAHCMLTFNIDVTKADENVYNHLNQANVEFIVDQTYAHIANAKYDPKSADERQQLRLNDETPEEARENDKHNSEEDSYDVLENTNKFNTKHMQIPVACGLEDEYHHLGDKS